MVIKARAPVRIDFAGGWTDVEPFTTDVGGAVLNATIDKYVEGRLDIFEESEDKEGISVSYNSQLPAGSGLGTSAVLNLLWLALIKGKAETTEDRQQLAELSYELERLLGIIGGRQDQYASAFGGFNLFTFTNQVIIEPIHLTESLIKELENRLILCYTGKQRLSSNIHERVWSSYRAGNPRVISVLHNLKRLPIEMKNALLQADLQKFSDLLAENWENQKALEESITNSQIEKLFKIATENGALSGKALGAGGGGCLIFFCEPKRKAEVQRKLEQAGAKIIEFRFEFQGLQVWSTG